MKSLRKSLNSFFIIFILSVIYLNPLFSQEFKINDKFNKDYALEIAKDTIWIGQAAWKSIQGWCHIINYNNPICKIDTVTDLIKNVSFEIVPTCSFDTSKLFDFSFKTPISEYLKIHDQYFLAFIKYNNVNVGLIEIFKNSEYIEENEPFWLHRILNIYKEDSKIKLVYKKISEDLQNEDNSIFYFDDGRPFFSYIKNDTVKFVTYDGKILNAKEHIKSRTTVEHIKKYAKGEKPFWWQLKQDNE